MIMENDDEKEESEIILTSQLVRGKQHMDDDVYEVTKFDTDSYPIKIDNCCSRTISHVKSDFIANTLNPVQNVWVKGFGNTRTKITHKGTIRWKVLDDRGIQQEIIIPNSYYVPEGNVRLLSPQHWAQGSINTSNGKEAPWCATYHDKVVLLWHDRNIKKTIPLDKTLTNTATMWSSPDTITYNTFIKDNEKWFANVCYDAVTDEPEGDELGFADEYEYQAYESILFADGAQTLDKSDNLIIDVDCEDKVSAKEEEELLRWHMRCGHISMHRLQMMAKRGILPSRLAKCRVPVCQSCLFGKMDKRNWKTKVYQEGGLDKAVKPGEMVSVDQLQSPIPGLVAQLKGTPTRERYTCATIFVDHFSDLTYVYLQRSTDGDDTLEAKREFERYARSCGVNVLAYHADNGRFVDSKWMNDMKNKDQSYSLCGVNAHHQNGRVEKRIRDLQDLGRSALLHGMKLWPDAITMALWPYAVRKAAQDMNSIPRKDKIRSPVEIFTGVEVVQNLNEKHAFGCPMYVLDNDLQSGKKIGKWKTRARMAIYIGPSINHAQSVGLALSLTTGLVSPVFHARYDDLFETLRDKYGTYVPKSQWQVKCGFIQENNVELWRGDVPKIENTESNINGNKDERQDDKSSNEDIQNNGNELHVPMNDLYVPMNDGVTDNELGIQDEIPGIPEGGNDLQRVQVQEQGQIQDVVKRTRVGREVKKPKRFDDYLVYESMVQAYMIEPEIDFVDPVEYMMDPVSYIMDLVAYGASSDPDIMYFHEILSEPDKQEFLKAMVKEIEGHNANNNWVVVNRATLGKNVKVLPAVWAMRRKRDLVTGEVVKWKARLNVDGSKQVYGENYWETYAPVASWASIRLIMCMAAKHRWKTKQLDFVQAYPQAPVETDIYIDIPKGCTVEGERDQWALKLVNNIYGQKQAGRVWNTFLIEGLTTKLGFRQSKQDPCILWRDKTIIVIYTDDTIITGPDEGQIDEVIKDIGSVFAITSQEKVSDFLGVNIARNEEDGSFMLTQQLLIKSIINDLGLKDDSNGRNTPALSSVILREYKESQPYNEKWHYRSIIGKLNYLEKSTRPDIAYAVHQCARFMENPKVEHAKAVKAIGRYLLATKDKGIICKPNEQSLECYSDADFAGNWNKIESEFNRDTARSRSGYIIKYAGCPLIWGSKLQTEIALSTTESEYISLSTSLREVIPLMELIKELEGVGFAFKNEKPKVYCEAFEDNEGALEMARSPKMRPRTKHINIKYHHFRDAVSKGDIIINAIDTEEQQADIFTKPLEEKSFIYLRKLIMGW
jgi:hypothetical protein